MNCDIIKATRDLEEDCFFPRFIFLFGTIERGREGLSFFLEPYLDDPCENVSINAENEL